MEPRDYFNTDYEPVAASQTAQTIGPVGGAGDILEQVIIVPATVSPGTVIIYDHETALITFPGGTNSFLNSSLAPVSIKIGARSKNGAFKITTGANVSVLAVGKFK